MLQDWGIDNVTAAPEKVYTWYFFYLIGHPKSIVRIESFHPVVQLHTVRVAGWSGMVPEDVERRFRSAAWARKWSSGAIEL